MNISQPAVRAAPPDATPLPAILLAAVVLAAGVAAAYQNGLGTPFVFDDVPAITENPTIRHFWTAWSPPRAGGLAVDGRPLLNVSLALSYALSGTQVWGYHAMNLVIHVLAGLTLFGVVRRTLLQPGLPGRFREATTPFALSLALVWALHPLQTESVTYVVQRAESQMGLFFLLMLYGFIRGTRSRMTHRWFWLATIACAAGMATKESMAAAPLLVLLYDRTFVGGSFAQAWRERRGLYVGLASTWLLLGWLVFSTHGRGGTAGFDTAVPAWAYAVTQLRAITLYLRLALWPRPLVFDYGTGLVTSAGEVALDAMVVALLVAGTLLALWRRPVIGFFGATFFALLAPSSSFVPVATQTMAEHRMYLPLAAVVVLLGLGLQALAGRRSVFLLLGIAIACGRLTFARNRDYRSDLALWSDTVAKQPGNARAHNNLGKELLLVGKLPEAVAQFEQALTLKPDYAKAHNNLGVALLELGRTAEALEHERTALRLNPADGESHHNLGNALLRAGRVPEAEAEYAEALRLRPDFAGIQATNLGRALLEQGQTERAIALLTTALRREPELAEAHNNLGNALQQTGRTTEALAHYAAALQLRPGDADTHFNFGNALLELGRLGEAQEQYRAALQIAPTLVEAHNNLGTVFFRLGDTGKAAEQYREALRLQPDYTPARDNLAMIEAAAK